MAQSPSFIATIGYLAVSYTLIKTIHLISIYALPSRFRRFAHAAPNGDAPWALVTGASDGIGTAFAQELAGEGFNVILHGRNHAKLSRVMDDLQSRHPGRSFKVLVADASRVACVNCIPTKEASAAVDFASIRDSLQGLHLTVLINNAGGGAINPICQTLMDGPEERITGNVSLNALFPLHLMRELLPMLVRGRPSLIMNVSSMSDMGFPLLASYSASKQFLMTLTRAIGLEMTLGDTPGMDKVEVLGVRFGRVTGVAGLKEEPSLFTPSAQTMARAALDRAGYGHGRVVGYWAHALQGVGFGILPTWLEGRAMQAVMRNERAVERSKKAQ